VNIRRIYNLKTLGIDDPDLYKTAHWSDHELFFDFCLHDLDQDYFAYQDAADDERICMDLKARHEIKTDATYQKVIEYVAISFDGKYIGLVIGLDGAFGYDLLDVYITDYPKYQAMLAYVRTMYHRPPDNIIGETTKLEDLDGRYGTLIDKRYKHNMRMMEKKK